MTKFNLTGSDVLVINSKPIQNDFAEGDYATVEFSDDLVSIATGKNQNTIYALNESGNNFEMTLNVLRGSDSDKYLNGLLYKQQQDFVSTTLMTGSITKRLGDGYGKVTFDTYTLRGMVISKVPGTKGNVNGDTDQGKTQYTFKGALAVRGIL